MLTWKTPEECCRFWQFLVGFAVPVYKMRPWTHAQSSAAVSWTYDKITEVRVRKTRRQSRLEFFTMYSSSHEPFLHRLGINSTTGEIYMKSIFVRCECSKLICDFVRAVNDHFYFNLSYQFDNVLIRYNRYVLWCAAAGAEKLPSNSMSRFRQHPLCDFRNLWKIIDTYLEK